MSGKTVFLADDSEIVLSMAGAALQAAGYTVETFSRWEDLDERLKVQAPDLILLDINMPEMHGDSVLMYYKEDRGIRDVPLLLFSDIEVHELEERAKECGADGFVSKGWGLERLVDIVGQQLAD
jgi:two-component system chemotaxis response regulator CheV